MCPPTCPTRGSMLRGSLKERDIHLAILMGLGGKTDSQDFLSPLVKFL